MSNKLILMYHSISSVEIPSVLGSYPVQLDEFKRHIDELREKGYKFDFISNLHSESSDEKIVYITGDDGTVDWTRNVLPWCEQEQIPTHTGIITGPFETKKVYPLTHLIQIILLLRDEDRLKRLSNKIKDKYLTQHQLDYINKIYFYETLDYRKIIKGAFNLIFEPKLAYELIGELTNEEYKTVSTRFEQLEYYKKFNFAEIGVHTKSHWALGTDIDQYLQDEIKTSYTLLKANGLNPTKYFVSPMKPRYGATLQDLVQGLQQLGFNGILDSNPGIWDNENYIIPRYDAKNFKEIFNQ